MFQIDFVQGFGLFAYLGLVAGAAIYGALNNSANGRDVKFEAIGYQRFGALMVAIVIASTMLGPADAMALSQNGLKYGLIWALFPLGAALAQLVSGKYLASKVVSRFQGLISLGDIFDRACHPSARVAAGFLVFAQAIAFSGVLVLAGAQLLEAFLHIPRVYGMVSTAVFVGLYTSFGGFSGVAWTDRVQFFFIVVLFGVLVLSSIVNAAHAPALSFSEVFATNAFWQDYDFKTGLGFFLAYFLGELLLPAYSVRALVARDRASAQNGFVIAAGMIAVWYVVVTLAGSVAQYIPVSARTAGDVGIILDIARNIAPPGSIVSSVVGVLVFIGLLAMIHSTFDSFLNVGAVAFARDFLGGLVALTDETQGWIVRRATFVIAIFGIVVATFGGSLIDILLVGYTIWVPSLLPGLLWLLLHGSKKLTPVAFWSGLVAGIAFWGFIEYVLTNSPAPSIAVGFVANFLVIGIIDKMAADREGGV